MPLNLPLPPGAPGQWIRVTTRSVSRVGWVKLELEDSARGQIVREGFFGPITKRGARSLMVHVPRDAGALRLRVYGEAPEKLRAHVRVLSRTSALLLLLALGYRQVPSALRGGLPGLVGRLRATLGQSPARAAQAPPYDEWIALFEDASEAPASGDMHLVIVGQNRLLIAASLASAGAAAKTAAVVRTAADWARLTALSGAPWVLILGAGEILAVGAQAAFAAAVAEDVDAVYADIDFLAVNGARHNPLFKPGPDRTLLRSGFLTSGACLFRVSAHAMRALPAEAGAARLTLALAARRVARIPRVLTHVPVHVQADTGVLADIVSADLRAQALTATATQAGAYVRVIFQPPAARPPRVSIIVPSAGRAAHVWRCLQRVALGTDYPNFEILLAVSRISASDRRQSRTLARLARLPRLRVLDLGMPDFNYAAVNNLAVQEATGDMLLLLNDDVSPITPGWLTAMVAIMQDGSVGAVGARLLYGNDTIQHGGVVMGLANLCEHAGRFRPASDPGPHGIARLDREVSAVTAACMLVRADAYRQVGGMDSCFAIALNDVDFCMRLREQSWRIVYAANITLYHDESLSLGRHYAGERAGLEALEVRRLRARWAHVIADDPYYNSNASLEPGRVWQPGFPPRLAASAGSGAKPAAPC